MSIEFPNPISAVERSRSWPHGHDIGVFLSIGDELTLLGTARSSADVNNLFEYLGREWGKARDVLEEDFFADVT